MLISRWPKGLQQLPKLDVTGSIPVSRSIDLQRKDLRLTIIPQALFQES